MMTVNEVSQLTGVSVRTLQYYDQIGLLPPSARTEAGYRLYDEAALETLQRILLYRELQFPLKAVKAILTSPDYDRNRALEQQIELLELRRQHLENLILFARGIKLLGVKAMDFKAFDTRKMDEYAEKAKASWGNTEAYREYEEKSKGRTPEDDRQMGVRIMAIFAEFGGLRGTDPAGEPAQALVKKLQDFITENCYTCTTKILAGLGQWYAGGGEITENIDEAGGAGTASFASEAIRIYCGKRDTENR